MKPAKTENLTAPPERVRELAAEGHRDQAIADMLSKELETEVPLSAVRWTRRVHHIPAATGVGRPKAPKQDWKAWAAQARTELEGALGRVDAAQGLADRVAALEQLEATARRILDS